MNTNTKEDFFHRNGTTTIRSTTLAYSTSISGDLESGWTLSLTTTSLHSMENLST